MIRKSIPLTLAEVYDLAGKGEKAENIKEFLKQFSETNLKKSIEMKEELSKLDLIKLKEDHIVKIVDFMPQDASDLAKVVAGVSFDQDEINKILEIVKKY